MKHLEKPEIIRMTSRNVVTVFTVAGMIIGYVVLHPLTMVIYQFEFHSSGGGWIETINCVFGRLFRSFDSGMLGMGLLFATIGGTLGYLAGSCLRSLEHKHALISIRERIMHEDVQVLIAGGESEALEFKASLRWDYTENRINKELGLPAVKTIAGFLNGNGGTLLIGVHDTGDVIGLHKDYTTFKHPDRDGVQQHLMQLVAHYFGADICPFIHPVFHRLNGKDLARIYIEPAPHPVYVSIKDKSLFYLRAGNGTRSLGIEEALSYVSGRWKELHG